MKLTDEQLKSISEDLDCGMNVYVNIHTNEIKKIINFDEHIYADEEMWQEDIDEIEENFDKYFEFEKMDSRDAYRVMEDFVDTVEDEELRKKLELGLRLSKPFRNFKDIIDEENEYRDKWFSFRDARNIEYVKEQYEDYINREEE